MATLYAVTAHIKNEVTGEPHIHYYTFDSAKAQAFCYSVCDILGIRGEINVYGYIEEGSLVPCRACEDARENSIVHEYVWSFPKGWIPGRK